MDHSTHGDEHMGHAMHGMAEIASATGFDYSLAFVAGFLGSGHCLGMCGALVSGYFMKAGKNKNGISAKSSRRPQIRETGSAPPQAQGGILKCQPPCGRWTWGAWGSQVIQGPFDSWPPSMRTILLLLTLLANSMASLVKVEVVMKMPLLPAKLFKSV